MDKVIWVRWDSITMWARDLEKWGRTNRLHSYLGKKYLREDGDYGVVYNLGIDGDTSFWLVKRFDVECEARQPDIIIFAIGSNDCNLINNKEFIISLDLFQKNLATLVEKAKKYTDKIVFIGQILCDESKTNPLPWAPEMSQDMKNTKLYNDATKAFCEENKLLFIDMMDVLDIHDLEDGIHPTAEGHEKMFVRIKDVLVEKKVI